MLRVRSSRRAAGLKPADYDHEIDLVDHDGTRNGEAPRSQMTAESQLLPPVDEDAQPSPSERTEASARIQERPVDELANEQEIPHEALRPSIEIQAPTPGTFPENTTNVVPKKPRVERETAIDILYENERGGFFCGRALFSSQALGSLDPTAWTNAYHKPSPTSIHTAQVPDPSWEWVWSDWHINKQEGVDDDGWEYSFAFSKKFSWHGPRWWNSFVRRRAWTRKRAKRAEEDISNDPHMLNTDYFTVRPASDRGSQKSRSLSSRVPSRTSLSQASSIEMAQQMPDIEDIETLMERLRFARIDREKLEATENYLENAMDLANLANEMHEIMSLFVFQASRRILLGNLMQIHADTTEALETDESHELKDKKAALDAAVKHADEEVRRLAYWSDIKQMTEGGESTGAVDAHKGWRKEWQGVDQSGPAQPNQGKAPDE